jgi:hypothetical protein
VRKIVLPITSYPGHKAVFSLISRSLHKETVKILASGSHSEFLAKFEWVSFFYPEHESWYDCSEKRTKRIIKGEKVWCDVLTYMHGNNVPKEFVFDISIFCDQNGRKKEKYTGSEYLDAVAVTARFNALVSQYEKDEFDAELNETKYAANIDTYMTEKKSRHDAYLAKLKKFAEEYPEIPSFLEKYANELKGLISDLEPFAEAKKHLRLAKRLMKENPHNEKIIENYGNALLFFSFYFFQLDYSYMTDMEETITMIYRLWNHNRTVYDLLDAYVYGLYQLFYWTKLVKEKERLIAGAQQLVEAYSSRNIVSKYVQMLADLIDMPELRYRKKYIAELKKTISRHPISLASSLRIADYIIDKKKLVMDNIDAYYGLSAYSKEGKEISGVLYDYFLENQNRDVLNSLPVEYLLNLTGCGVGANCIIDCYKIVGAFLAENPQNIDLACMFAQSLVWDIQALHFVDFERRVTVRIIKFLCGELKKLYALYPRIQIIAEKYAEGLRSCLSTYTTKKDQEWCRKTLSKLKKGIRQNEDIWTRMKDIGGLQNLA